MIADGRFGPRTCGVPLRVIWDLDLSGRARIVGRDQIDQLEAPVNVNPTKKIINPNLKSKSEIIFRLRKIPVLKHQQHAYTRGNGHVGKVEDRAEEDEVVAALEGYPIG